MRKLILLISIVFFAILSNAQGKLERYSCKTPIVTIDYNYLNYNGINYDSGVYFSINTFNCRWLTYGFEGLSLNNSTNNSGNELSVSGIYYSGIAGINQPPFSGRAYVITAEGKFYSDYVLFSVAGTLPSVSTTSVSGIGTGDAYSGGSISSDGGNSITAKGVVWGYDSSVSLGSYVGLTSDGSGSSSYSSHMTGLSQGTVYYVKAYATTTIGTGYGNAIQFTTQQSVYPPTVSTATIDSIASTSAYSGGSIVYTGGGSIAEKGVCWNTSGSPNYNNSKTNDGSGTASFTSFMSGLSPSTTYYVRAYARACGMVNGFNVCATGYGEELSFTTTSSGNVPTLATNSISNITSNSASSGGSISSDGGSSILQKGVQWSLDSGFNTIEGSTNNGTGSGSFSSLITGLNCGSTYYVRSYATNSIGTGYGNPINFATSGTPSYIVSGLTRGASSPRPFSTSETIYIGDVIAELSFAESWQCGEWATVVITGFNSDYDGDGFDLYSIKDGGTSISSFPYNKSVIGLSSGSPTNISLSATITQGPFVNERCSVTYYIVNNNGVSGASQTMIYTIYDQQ